MEDKETRRSSYPPHWKHMRLAVLARAGYRCEGSPQYPDCRAENGKPHPVTGSLVVLTTAHKEGASTLTQDLGQVMALCQRCHLAYDQDMHQRNAAATRQRKRLAAQGARSQHQARLVQDAFSEDEARMAWVQTALEDFAVHGSVERALLEIMMVFPRADGRCSVPGCTTCTPEKGPTPSIGVLSREASVERRQYAREGGDGDGAE